MEVLTESEKLLSKTQKNHYPLNHIFTFRRNVIIVISFLMICLGGCVTTGVRTKTFNDGSTYVGEFKDGKRNGQGTSTWGNGDKYVGEWKDGKRHGQGTGTWGSGNKYVGEWKDGKTHGQGTLTWGSGDKYVGEWKDGKTHGQGTLTWPNGSKYVGTFKDDEFDGQGVINWPDGSKYVGEFRGYEGHKEGIITSPEGAKYAGNLRFNALILDIEKDSNGEQAGLLKGDIIVEYDGISIVNGDEQLISIVKKTQVQNRVIVKVMRKEVEKHFILNGGIIGVFIQPYPRFETDKEHEIVDQLILEARKLEEEKSFLNALLKASDAWSLTFTKERKEKLFSIIVRLYQASPTPPPFPEEARRYRIWAQEAVKEEHYEDALKYFAEALKSAPWWAEGFYNGAVLSGGEQMKLYSNAILLMNKYLQLVPNGEHSRAAQDKIYSWEGKIK